MSTTAQSADTIINSPFVIALFTVGSSVAMGAVIGVVRLLMNVARIEQMMKSLSENVREALADKDIMRWSTLQGAQVHVTPDAQIKKGGAE